MDEKGAEKESERKKGGKRESEERRVETHRLEPLPTPALLTHPILPSHAHTPPSDLPARLASLASLSLLLSVSNHEGPPPFPPSPLSLPILPLLLLLPQQSIILLPLPMHLQMSLQSLPRLERRSSSTLVERAGGRMSGGDVSSQEGPGGEGETGGRVRRVSAEVAGV